MPIIDIEIIGNADEHPRELAQQLADAAGTAMKSRPQGTWLKLRYIKPEHYAENGGLIDELPIIVKVVQAEVPSKQLLEAQISALTSAIATCTRRSTASVHVLIEPAAAGRIAFGGALVP